MKIQKELFSARHGFLLRLCSTILLFICIPFLLVQFFLSKKFVAELSDSEQKYCRELLKNNSQEFFERIQELQRAAESIAHDEEVQLPLTREPAGYSLYAAANRMLEYENMIGQVRTVGVYYPSQQFVLDGKYSRTLEWFCRLYSGYDETEQARLEKFFETVDDFRILGLEGTPTGQNALLVAQPVRLQSLNGQKVVVFFLLDNRWEKYLYSDQWISDIEMVLYDAEGDEVFSTDYDLSRILQENYLHEIYAPGQGEEFGKHVRALTVRDERMLWSAHTDPITGYSCALFSGELITDKIKKEYIHEMQSMLLLSAVLVMLAGGATIYLNYRPLHQLLRRHKKLTENQTKSELDILDMALTNMGQKISAQQEMLIDYVLADLLHGTPVNEANIRNYISQQDYLHYVVGAVDCDKLSAEQNVEISRKLNQNMEESLLFITDLPSVAPVLLVYMSKKEIDAEELSRQVNAAFAEGLGISCKVYWGTAVSQLDKIKESYMEALGRQYKESGEESNQNALYPSKDIQQFSVSILAKNQKSAQTALKKLNRLAISEEIAPVLRQYFSHDLLRTFINAADKNGITMEKAEVEQLLEIEDVQMFFTRFKKMVDKYFMLTAQNENKTSMEYKRKMLEYVDREYTSYNLCLNAVADYMGMSIYVVSRLFKEYTGMGFKEYVTQKRLETACEILKSTAMPVTEVAANVGFDNPAYFTSVFKATYSITPSKYREQNKE